MPRNGKIPRLCGCGCDGLTKGGEFLPGHDARFKGNLKRKAKAGDHDAFDTLVERGWVLRSDVVLYPALDVVPEQNNGHILAVGGVAPEYDDILQNSPGTVGEKAKREAALFAVEVGLHRVSFEKYWEKAMSALWPDQRGVIRLAVSWCDGHYDAHENTVRDIRWDEQAAPARIYRRVSCHGHTKTGAICDSKLIFLSGEYHLDPRLEVWLCDNVNCTSMRFFPRPGLEGQEMEQAQLASTALEDLSERAYATAE